MIVGTKTWAHTAGGATPLVTLWNSETGQLEAIIEAFALGQMRTGGISGRRHRPHGESAMRTNSPSSAPANRRMTQVAGGRGGAQAETHPRVQPNAGKPAQIPGAAGTAVSGD